MYSWMQGIFLTHNIWYGFSVIYFWQIECVRNGLHDFSITMYCMLLKCILDPNSKKISHKDITYFFALLSRVNPKGNKWNVNGEHKKKLDI
jgi:hypothetical protein